jgi:SMC interacting uncharacterized protein involved in chromosome segregation
MILTKNLHYAKNYIINIFEKENQTMKHAAEKSTVDMLHKIETIEKEVMDLKLSVLKKLTPSGKKVVSLKGILKGVEITEQDINNAKKSLYGKVGL